MAERVRGVVALAPSTLHPRHAPAGLEAHLRSWRENREAPILNFDGLLLVSGGSRRLPRTFYPSVAVLR